MPHLLDCHKSQSTVSLRLEKSPNSPVQPLAESLRDLRSRLHDRAHRDLLPALQHPHTPGHAALPTVPLGQHWCGCCAAAALQSNAALRSITAPIPAPDSDCGSAFANKTHFYFLNIGPFITASYSWERIS